jgi:hypothetical protein
VGLGSVTGVGGSVTGVGVEASPPEVGVEGLLSEDVVDVLGASVVAVEAFGDGVVAVGSGVVGFLVAPGVRPATTGASLAGCGSAAMWSAVAVSPRVNVSTAAVAIVVTTTATATLWVLPIRMGLFLALGAAWAQGEWIARQRSRTDYLALVTRDRMAPEPQGLQVSCRREG